MRKMQTRSDSSGARSTPTGAEINNQNWVALASASIRAQGGQGFVIRNEAPKLAGPATPAEWHAWMLYFEDHGIATKYLRFHGVGTVPTRWPEEFDLTREPSDKTWRFPPRAFDPAMRRRVLGLGLALGEL